MTIQEKIKLGFRNSHGLPGFGMSGGGAAPVNYTVDFGTVSDGATPAGLDHAGNWSVSGGKAISNPTLGDEIVTDTGMELWTSATNLTNFIESLSGTSTVNQEATEKHSGNYAARVDLDAAGSMTSVNFLVPAAPNDDAPFMRVSYWAKSDSGTPSVVPDGPGIVSHTISDTFTEYIKNGMRAKAAFFVNFKNIASGSANKKIYWDDVSIKRVSTRNALLVKNFAKPKATVRVIGSNVPGTLYSILSSLDSSTNPQNYILARIQTNYAYLYKMVNGVFSAVLTSGSIGNWLNGCTSEIVWTSSTTVELRFNGQLVGSPVSITDASIIDNTLYGVCSIDARSDISSIKIYSAVGKSIFSIGDSITALFGTDEYNGNGYPAALIDLFTSAWQENPIRYGTSSYKTSDTRAGIDAELATRTAIPDYTLVYLGANDVVSMPVEATYKTNVAYIIDAVHTKWPNTQIYYGVGGRLGNEAQTIILAGWNASVISGREAYCHVGINYNDIFSGHEAELLIDGSTHPNHAGYLAMGQAWKNLGIS